MKSIRSNLLLWQLTAVFATVLFTGALTYGFAQRGFDAVRDHQLLEIAQAIALHNPAAEAASGADRPDPVSQPTTATGADAVAPDEVTFVGQVWDPNGRLVFSAPSLRGPPLQPAGFHQVSDQGRSWRTFTQTQDEQYVQVAALMTYSRGLFQRFVPWVLLPLLLLLLALGFLIHRAASKALQPLDFVRTHIERQALADLQPLPTERLPDEVRALAHTINQLLDQWDQQMASQRRFLADAAHELNTPLAVIKLQAPTGAPVGRARPRSCAERAGQRHRPRHSAVGTTAATRSA